MAESQGYKDEQVERFWEEVSHTMRLAEDVFASRAQAYDGVSVLDKFVFGDKSIFTMIWSKIQRLRSCMYRQDAGQNVADTLDDSILDAINYLAMLRAWYVIHRGEDKGHD